MKRCLLLAWFVLLLIGAPAYAAPQDPPAPAAPAALPSYRWYWQGSYLSDPTATPDVVGPHLAIGGSPTSAVSRWVAYYDATLGNLMVAHWVGASSSTANCGTRREWQCEVVDGDAAHGGEANVGQYPALAYFRGTNFITDPDRVGVTYLDVDSGALKYATVSLGPVLVGTPRVWSRSVVYQGLAVRESSLAYLPDETPVVGFHALGIPALFNGLLAYAKRTTAGTGDCAGGSDWNCLTISVGSGVTGRGGSVSLALDGATPWIGYYDAEGGDLWVAHENLGSGNCGPGNNTWTCTPIVSDGDMGATLALTIPPGGLSAGAARLAFVDRTGSSLMLATSVASGGNCGGGRWRCITLDSMPGASALKGKLDIANNASGDLLVAYQRGVDNGYGDYLGTVELARYVGLGGNCGPTYTMTGPGGILIQYQSWWCQRLEGPSRIDQSLGAAVGVWLNPQGLATVIYHEVDEYYDDNLKLAEMWGQVMLPLVAQHP